MNSVKHNVSMIAADLRKMSDKQGIFVPITDFAQLRHHKYFVDKSPIIDALLNDNTASFITTPSGFGKSTLLSTLKYFFEIQVDPKDGKAVTKTGLFSEEIITGTTNYDLFKGLKISQWPEAMKQFGKWPVIFVDFKACDPVTSVEKAVDICRYATHKCYKQHSYLLKSENLSDSDKRKIAGWCDEEMFKSKDSFDVSTGLSNLTEFLKSHWRKHSVILVDEYDSIFMNALACESVETDQLNSIISVVARLLFYVRTAQGHSCTKRIVVAGITDLSNITYDLRLGKTPFLEHHRYSEFYGLLESEVKKLLTKSGSQIPYEDIRSYYGYTTYGGQSIFNTSSIMNFLEYQRLEPYWCRTGSIVGLYESCEKQLLRSFLVRLKRDDTIVVELNSHFSKDETKKMKNFFTNPQKMNEDLIFSFFLDQGLLSAAVVSSPENTSTRISYCSYDRLKFKIANTEMKENLQLAIDAFYEKSLSPCEKERAKTTEVFGRIFEFIDSKEELRCSLTEYLTAMKNFTYKAFSGQFTIHHQDLMRLIVEAAKSLCPMYRLNMNLEEFKIENGGSIDFCALYSGELYKIAIIMKLDIDKKDIGNVKDEIINEHYIYGLNNDDFKDAKQAIIMGLNFIKRRGYIENPSKELKFELIYTVCQLGHDKNINLHDNEWEILKSE